MAQRRITVSSEAIRLWCIKFGAIYTRRLKRKHRGYGDTFYIDEVSVKISDRLAFLHAATMIEDMDKPGYRLHALKGKLKGH